MKSEDIVPKAFPKLDGVLVNLREVSINDAQDITHLMSYNVSKYLWEVPNPYSVEDALDFIKSAHIEFKSIKALHFAIEYKAKSKPRNNVVLVGAISLKNMDLVNKKASLGRCLGQEYPLFDNKQVQPNIR